MNTFIDKSGADRVAPGRRGSEPVDSLADHRPEATAQRKSQAMVDGSPQAKQAAQLQAMADLHGQPVAQRVIDPAVFARLDHSIVLNNPTPYARLIRDAGGAVCMVKRVAAPVGGFEVATQPAAGALPVWVAVTAANLQGQYTWPDERIDYNLPAAFEPAPDQRRVSKVKGADNVNQVGAGGAALTIREFAGDDLAMVHHTTGGGSEPHLTVENAHISAMHHVQDMRKIQGFDKGGKTKPEHEALMAGYGSAPTDNLNFFAAGGAQAVHNNLSLHSYLRVVQHAMDQIAHVPPVYGVEIVRSANAMAAAQGMDPAAVFLASGVGLERQVFKAALNMHRMGLIAVPAAVVAAFTGYAQPAPQLTDPLNGTVVHEGEAAWSELQTRLVTAHFPALVAYLLTL